MRRPFDRSASRDTPTTRFRSCQYLNDKRLGFHTVEIGDDVSGLLSLLEPSRLQVPDGQSHIPFRLSLPLLFRPQYLL